MVKNQLSQNSRRLILLAHANRVDGQIFADLIEYLSMSGCDFVGLDRLFIQEKRKKALERKQIRDERRFDPS